jgi:hypothetical protein
MRTSQGAIMAKGAQAELGIIPHPPVRLPLLESVTRDGRNLLPDVTMASGRPCGCEPVSFGLAAYSLEVVIALISTEDAVRWADADHRRRCEGSGAAVALLLAARGRR